MLARTTRPNNDTQDWAKAYGLVNESFYTPAKGDFVVIRLNTAGHFEIDDYLCLRYLDSSGSNVSTAWYVISRILLDADGVTLKKHILRHVDGGEVGQLVPLHTSIVNCGPPNSDNPCLPELS